MKIFSQRFVLLAGIFLAGFAARLSAQTLTPLFTNGPTANRINIVLLAEGYQLSESNKFITDAAGLVAGLMSVSPYSEYTNYFNAYAIFVASTNSGSDHYTTCPNPPNPPTPLTNLVNTYFNSSYDYGYQNPANIGVQRLISIPPNSFDTNYNNGKGKVFNLLTNLMPEYDVPILLVNDTCYGGSGNTPDAANPLVIVSVNIYMANVVAHECGHLIGGLADEYTNAIPEITNLVERPNATTNTAYSLIPWKSWIDPDTNNTPIPTPPTYALYSDTVGLFLGAQYHTNLWYRPKLAKCIMNNIQYGGGFCPVCAEAIVKGIYTNPHFSINPIDSFTPANNPLTVTTTNTIAFTATPLQPATHNLNLQWFTNGVAVLNATNPAFSLLPQNSPVVSTNTVQVQATDFTPLVINDPNNDLSNSVAWNVVIGISNLKLLTPQLLASGQFSCSVTGLALNGFVMQTSTNFTTWTALATNTLTGGAFNFTNNPAGLTRRFYRALAN